MKAVAVRHCRFRRGCFDMYGNQARRLRSLATPTERRQSMYRIARIAVSLLFAGAELGNAQAVGQRVTVNGMKMYYEVSGTGDPLIVLHGAYMNIPTMGAIIPALAKTHKVYALELQGHGRTTDIDRPITYPNLADDVAAFMNAVGLQKADVFGYSMGAGTGMQLGIRDPERVNKHVVAW